MAITELVNVLIPDAGAGTWLLPVLLAAGVGVPLGLAWVYSRREHASVNLLFELPALKRRPVASEPGVRRSGA